MDFDGNDRLDLISGSTSNDPDGFHLFPRNEDGSWAPRRRLEMKSARMLRALVGGNFMTAADWNGDGWPDLIVTRDVYSPVTPDGKQDCRGTVWLYLRE